MSGQRNHILLGIVAASALLSSSFFEPAMARKTISAALAPVLEKGYNQMMEGDYASAVKTLGGAVETDKDCITARRYLAFALVKSKHPKEAIAELNTISKAIKPTYFEWCTFGEAYLSTGSLDQAESCYKQAVKASPKNAYAKSGLIRLSIKAENYDQALALATEGMQQSRKTDAYEYFKNLYTTAYAAQHAAQPAPTGHAPASRKEFMDQYVSKMAPSKKSTAELLRRAVDTPGHRSRHPG